VKYIINMAAMTMRAGMMAIVVRDGGSESHTCPRTDSRNGAAGRDTTVSGPAACICCTVGGSSHARMRDRTWRKPPTPPMR
jgi:hypothetical protein